MVELFLTWMLVTICLSQAKSDLYFIGIRVCVLQLRPEMCILCFVFTLNVKD